MKPMVHISFLRKLNLPKSAVRSKADLVVHSLHKSLNGLTQTAVIWHNGNLIEENNLIKSINLLQTTSPSSSCFPLVRSLSKTG